MRTPRSFSRRARAPQLRARQGGTILIIALIVLVVMTLAGIATMRSVDTATITAGYIGLRQASVNAADQGIQAGVNWLTANLGPTLFNDNHQPGTASKGYFSSVPANDPDWSEPLNLSEAGQLNNGDPDDGGTDRARLRPDSADGLPYHGAGHPFPRYGEGRRTAQLDFDRSILGEGVQ